MVIPDEVLEDNMTLDVMLTPCNALIHINSRPVDTSVARNDREVKIMMREAARPVLDAVNRHGELTHDNCWNIESASPLVPR